VALAVDRCPQYDETRLRELVSIEVRTVGADAPPRRSTVRLTCSADQIDIQVTDELTSSASRSQLNLGGVPEATRLRLLALTITELVAVSWREPRAAPPRSPPPTLGEGPAPSAPPWPAIRVFGATTLRRMGRPGTWLIGAGAGGEYALHRWLAVALDLRVEGGDTDIAVAAVGWRAVSATAAVALGGDSGARFSLTASPGLTVAAVRLSAAGNSPDAHGAVLDGVWAGPTLSVRARYRIGRSAFAQLEASGGVVTRGIVGLLNGTSPLVQVQGPWALAGAGAGFAF
jgi:hypothetical protein